MAVVLPVVEVEKISQVVVAEMAKMIWNARVLFCDRGVFLGPFYSIRDLSITINTILCMPVS